VSAQPLEIRMARLEGAYEQIDRRLGTIEMRLESMESRFDQRFNAVDQRFNAVDQRFNVVDQRLDKHFIWSIGTTVGTWITVMLAIFLHH
jgi:tetrahydromethanopterin S-methyltransferase subunit G